MIILSHFALSRNGSQPPCFDMLEEMLAVPLWAVAYARELGCSKTTNLKNVVENDVIPEGSIFKTTKRQNSIFLFNFQQISKFYQNLHKQLFFDQARQN